MLQADKQNRIIELGPHAGILQHVASLETRINNLNSLLDGIFTASSEQHAKPFAWRRGVFGWGRKCICGIRFTRGHISCMPYNPGILLPDELPDYELEKQFLLDNINYRSLDYLINHRHWLRAIRVLDYWTTTMSSMLQATTQAS